MVVMVVQERHLIREVDLSLMQEEVVAENFQEHLAQEDLEVAEQEMEQMEQQIQEEVVVDKQGTHRLLQEMEDRELLSFMLQLERLLQQLEAQRQQEVAMTFGLSQQAEHGLQQFLLQQMVTFYHSCNDMEPATSMPMTDHDLLIELKTTIGFIRVDLKDLKDGLASRVTALEVDKIGRMEAVKMQTDALTVHNDHETRLRTLEKGIDNLDKITSSFQSKVITWGSASIVALGIIEFVISFFFHK